MGRALQVIDTWNRDHDVDVNQRIALQARNRWSGVTDEIEREPDSLAERQSNYPKRIGTE